MKICYTSISSWFLPIIFFLGIPNLTIKLLSQSSFLNIIEQTETAIEVHSLLKTESLLRNIPKTNSPAEKADSLLIISKYQYALGNYLKAKNIAEQANKLINNQTNSFVSFKLSSWRGRMAIEWFDLEKGEKLLIQAGKVAIKQKYTKSIHYQYWQYYFGLLEIAKKNYALADSVFNLLLNQPDLQKQSDILFYKVHYSLGESKGEQELFEEADSILCSINSVIDEQKGKESFFKIIPLNHLVRFYTKNKRYDDGINAFLTAKSIVEINGVNEEHPVFGDLLTNYGKLLIEMGKFTKAEVILIKAEPIYRKLFDNTPRYIFVLGPLKTLYGKLGHTQKSISYALKEKEIYKNLENYIDYARVLNNLSAIYLKQQEFEKSEQLFNEGMNLLEENNQTHTATYAVLLMNYANLKIDIRAFNEAQDLLSKSKSIVIQIFGNNHPYYAALVNNLAYLNKKTKNYQKAKNYYLETEKIDSSTVGIRHPYYISTTYSLASIHELTKELTQSHQYFQRANAGQINLIYNYYSGFDEAIRLSYLSETEPDFHQFLSFAWRHQKEIPSLTTEAQNLNLAVKNLALDFSAQKQIRTNEIKDSTLINTYQTWIATKKKLSQSYIQSPEEQEKSGVNVEALENKAELLEKELVRSEVLSMGDLANQHRTTFDEIKQALKPKEAAIDFIRFVYYLPERKTDSVYYCALINQSTFDQPQMVFLGEEKRFKQLLSANVRLNGFNYIENEQIRQDFYQEVWQPLEPYLKGIEQIDISASGLLHKVAFGAIQDEQNKPLIHKYNFTYYDNLKYIKQSSSQQEPSNQRIVLMGAAEFDLDSLQLSDLAKAQQSTKSDNSIELPTVEEFAEEEETDLTRSGVVFNYLPATQKEVLDISEQFKIKDWQVNTYTNLDALEENFKSLEEQNAPSILHIATHGYFFEPLKEGRRVPNNARGRIMAAKNPLLRSGLAFSGANYAWKWGKNIPNLEDGILTAYEIANQNLANTDLVVLSACETGRGDVVNGEGVFGLQRAFKIAGVENMLISLWKVPDQQTQELMTTFYQFYLQSNDASKALHQAQISLSKKYRPFYWGGFIVAR